MLVKKYEFQSFDSGNDDQNINGSNSIIIEHITNVESDIMQNEVFESINELNNINQKSLEDDIQNAKILNEQLVSILKNINTSIEHSIKNNNNIIDNFVKDMSKLTVNIAKKIALKALKENPLDEIETFIKDSFKFFKSENEIKIILNPSMVESVKAKVEELYPEFISKNKIIFESETEIDNYNCKISWNDGGLIFDKEEIIEKIEKLF